MLRYHFTNRLETEGHTAKELVKEEKVSLPGRKNNKTKNFTHKMFYTNVLALSIESITVGNAGYITKWTLANSCCQCIIGETQKELIDTLDSLITDLHMGYKYSEKMGKENEDYKDCLVIYTEDIVQVLGFLLKNASEIFESYSFCWKNFIEFRNSSEFATIEDIEISGCICDDYAGKTGSLAMYMQNVVDSQFLIRKENNKIDVKKSKFHLTPFSVVRKSIKISFKANKDDTAEKLFPIDYKQYNSWMHSYFGGLCFASSPKVLIEQHLLKIDRTSAYIYDMLCESHATKQISCDKSQWKDFLDSHSKISIGYYKITFVCQTTKLNCYRDKYGKRIKKVPETQTIEIALTNIDLKNFITLAKEENIESIECENLIAFCAGSLPKYLMDVIVNYYTNKSKLKKEKIKDWRYGLAKQLLNGIYGVECEKIRTAEDFKEKAKDPIFCPLWGIFTTSYAKKNLIELGDKLEGWVYSDTDSIICLDTLQNRKIIKEVNNDIRLMVEVFCETYGYDFNILQGLGEFVLEDNIEKFLAHGPKQYVYKTKEGHFEIKVAGAKSNESTLTEKDWFDGKIQYGTRERWLFNEETTTTTYNGKTLISEGSSYKTRYSADTALGITQLIIENKINKIF